MVLTGCGSNTNPPAVTPVNTTPVPPVSTNQSNPEMNVESDMIQETGIETESETIEMEEPAPPIDMAEANFSLGNVQALVSEYNLNEDPQFLSCAFDTLTNCQTQVSTQSAIEEKDPDLCDNISDETQAKNCKDQLWNQLATMEDDVEMCANISEEFSRTSCQDQYWRNAASASQDLDLCVNINEPFLQDECSNQIRLQLAVDALDVALCANIKQYEYTFADMANPDATPEELAAAENAPPQRVELPAEQNFMLQDCEQQVAFAIEFAEQEAEMAAAQAQAEAEFAAQQAAEEAAQAEAEAEAAAAATEANTEEPGLAE